MNKVKDTLFVPVAIPVWGLMTLIGTGLFSAGMIYSQLQAVLEKQKIIDVVYERQIKNLENVAHIERDVQNHELRIASLERTVRK